MPEIARLSVNSDWIDLEFMRRTPEQAVELGIQMHVAGLSLSNTTSVLEDLGVKKSEISEPYAEIDLSMLINLGLMKHENLRFSTVSSVVVKPYTTGFIKPIYSLMTVEIRITLR